MAKKKAAAKKPAAAAAATGPGLGKKHCPHCEAVIAARSTTCPECHKAIKPKKKAKKKTAKNPVEAYVKDESNALVRAIKFVKESGGIKQARKELDDLDDLKGLL